MLKFKCLIQDEDKTKDTKSADRLVDIEQPETMELGEFEDWATNKYQIHGGLTLYSGREKLKKLDDPYVELGSVLKPGDTLTIKFDKEVTSAAGGYGGGGTSKGVLAEAGGGRGKGGDGDEEGVEGGGGFGGNAKGAGGAAGEGIGGPANTGLRGGRAKGGSGVGWKFTMAGGGEKKQT